jgi:DNA-directed RNA polymerase subunit RPC12/RpoP
MSLTTRRILLAMACLCAVPTFYLMIFLFVERFWLPADEDAFLATTLLTIPVLTVVWVLFWRRTIRWTRARSLLTVLAVFWSAGFAGILMIILSSFISDAALVIVIASWAWMPTWILSTALIWCETRIERMSRSEARTEGLIRCPQCGYDLRGLSEARCPECGSRYTLDQLVALALGDGSELTPDTFSEPSPTRRDG